jgi:hypothetical protein
MKSFGALKKKSPFEIEKEKKEQKERVRWRPLVRNAFVGPVDAICHVKIISVAELTNSMLQSMGIQQEEQAAAAAVYAEYLEDFNKRTSEGSKTFVRGETVLPSGMPNLNRSRTSATIATPQSRAEHSLRYSTQMRSSLQERG